MRQVLRFTLIAYVLAANVLYSAARTPHRIVATTGMIADLARQVGGESVDVVQIVPAGGNPHSYTPNRRDVARLMQADLVLYNGVLLEGRMGNVLERMRQRGKPVYAVAHIIRSQGDFVLTDECPPVAEMLPDGRCSLACLPSGRRPGVHGSDHAGTQRAESTGSACGGHGYRPGRGLASPADPADAQDP